MTKLQKVAKQVSQQLSLNNLYEDKLPVDPEISYYAQQRGAWLWRCEGVDGEVVSPHAVKI